MIKQAVRHFCYGTTRCLGIHRILGLRAQGVTAVMYHGIESSIFSPDVQESQILESVFRDQIHYLRKHFEIISLEDFLQRRRDGQGIDGRQVLLTFDDGYRNNLVAVGPLLSEYNLPFAIFINSRNVEEGSRQAVYYCRVALKHTEQKTIALQCVDLVFDIRQEEDRLAAQNKILKIIKTQPQKIANEVTEELKTLLPTDRWEELGRQYHSEALLSWDELRELQKMGATIGSHCHDHAILHQNQSPEEIKLQLRLSKETIEKQLGRCTTFVYPNGGEKNISRKAVQLAEQCGYQAAFASVLGEITQDSNLLCLPRIGGSDSVNSFVWHIHSAWRYNHRFQKWWQSLQVPSV